MVGDYVSVTQLRSMLQGLDGSGEDKRRGGNRRGSRDGMDNTSPSISVQREAVRLLARLLDDARGTGTGSRGGYPDRISPPDGSRLGGHTRTPLGSSRRTSIDDGGRPGYTA